MYLQAIVSALLVSEKGYIDAWTRSLEVNIDEMISHK